MLGKIKLLILFPMSLLGCKLKFEPQNARIYVVQEVKLSNSESLFWFRNEDGLLHEGLSYFQITDDKCKLSVATANAYCELPEQIMDFKGDTIYILTRAEIVFTNPIKRYKIKAVEYEHRLFDIYKKPKRAEMFFLDTACGQNCS